jgi:hypothetical protein
MLFYKIIDVGNYLENRSNGYDYRWWLVYQIDNRMFLFVVRFLDYIFILASPMRIYVEALLATYS